MGFIENKIIHYLSKNIKNIEPIAAEVIETQNFELKFKNLPESFNNFKICHLSDIHNVDLFGEHHEIPKKIEKENPDIIVISGDMTEGSDIHNTIKNIKKLKQIISARNIFITTGNHEFMHEKLIDQNNISEIFEQIENEGIVYLRNKHQKITRDDESIYIVGIDDPYQYADENDFVRYQLEQSTKEIPPKEFKILISHRPEKIKIYSEFNMDLVFSGHAHGGQIKIPFLNRGVLSPHQPIFPKYIDGLYKNKNTQMLVSPGLSNGINIPRINNPGKIFFVKLHNI